MLRRYLISAVTAALTLIATSVHAEDGVTSDTVLLGATNATTGPVAAPCSGVAAGAQSYIAKINAAGGVVGRKIQYDLLDDGYSAQRATGNVRRLLQQDKVFAVLGGCGTATAAAALAALEKTEVPYLFPYAGLQRIVEPPKPNVLALLPLYPTQLSVLLPYVIEQAKPKTAALFTFNIAGHEDVQKTMNDILAKAGVKVVVDALMEVSSPERGAFALQAKDANVDLVVLNDSSPGAARFVIEMQRQNWKPKAITGVSTLTDEAFLRAVGNGVDGILMAPGVVLPPNAPEAKDCVDALTEFDKSVPPSHYTMFGCLTAKVMAEGLKRAGTDLTRASLLAAFDGLDGFDPGIAGKIAFSPEQRMGLGALYVFSVEGGAFKVGDSLPIPK
ncbi:branched-chain amino acid transport system substrate-binding protein [Rhodoligotrophos appendicifer]|uniref:ABC transporter substrate-binding protein n=1 Tax=Rhodoligotrophos appendicifer TaxID=987056 RepID=UPI001185ED50|nr:ABC transporter substrate-binding protein [Rhodoligotrophos appendicifer]